MTREGPDRALEFELHALISKRYRGVYLHDLRGGLQVLQNAIEVLVRVATAARSDAGMSARTSELARRALAAHGELIDATLERLVPSDDAAADCSASLVVGDVVAFLRSQFAARSISLQAQPGADFRVAVPASRLRLVLLVVLTAVLDDPHKAGAVQVSVERDGSWGTLIVSTAPAGSRPAADAAPEIHRVEGPFDLSTRRRLVGLDGGEVQCRLEPNGAWRQELRYPLAPSAGTS